MKVLYSHEFYDLHRGEKDFIIPHKLSVKGYNVSILPPNRASLNDINNKYHFSKKALVEKANLVKVFIYPAFCINYKTKNKIISFILPLPFIYLLILIFLRPDVIIESIYTTLTPRSYLNYFYAVIFNKKRILLDPGDQANKKTCFILEKKAINDSYRIFCNNFYGLNRIVRKYNFNFIKGKVIPKILNADLFYYSNRTKKSKITIGYVGRLLKVKGFDKFLQIAEKIDKNNFEIVVAGSNDENYNMMKYIQYKGVVKASLIADIYREIDILFLPDMSEFHGYSTVIQEAMMCGCLTCVGTDDLSTFPLHDYVYFYKPVDIDKVVEYINLLDNTQIHKIRESISHFYKEACSPDMIMNEITDVLEGLI